MFSFLLPVIYIAFISLGLPDSILGAAWPVMGAELNAPLEACGIISMIIAGGTIVSSLMSDRLTRRFGAGLITSASVALTAAALFGFSIAPNYSALCLLAVPYGLGAGAVDSALNNFVALHYKARHMSWLHCFWGVGASSGPYIMAFYLTGNAGWHGGYRAISFIQVVLTALLIFSLPLWKKVSDQSESDSVNEAIESKSAKKNSEVIKIRGVPYILIAFFCYCAMELSTGLWASSYLVTFRNVEPDLAARFASFFYLGITGGRLLNGFVAEKLGDRNMIRIGACTAAAGIVMVLLPFSFDYSALAGLIVIGLGCAPIYPSIIHATPDNFGRSNSQAIVGLQMASAYTGSTLMPTFFGVIASKAGIGIYPLYLMIFAAVILAATEKLNRMLGK